MPNAKAKTVFCTCARPLQILKKTTPAAHGGTQKRCKPSTTSRRDRRTWTNHWNFLPNQHSVAKDTQPREANPPVPNAHNTHARWPTGSRRITDRDRQGCIVPPTSASGTASAPHTATRNACTRRLRTPRVSTERRFLERGRRQTHTPRRSPPSAPAPSAGPRPRRATAALAPSTSRTRVSRGCTTAFCCILGGGVSVLCR